MNLRRGAHARGGVNRVQMITGTARALTRIQAEVPKPAVASARAMVSTRNAEESVPILNMHLGQDCERCATVSDARRSHARRFSSLSSLFTR